MPENVAFVDILEGQKVLNICEGRFIECRKIDVGEGQNSSCLLCCQVSCIDRAWILQPEVDIYCLHSEPGMLWVLGWRLSVDLKPISKQ